MALTDAFLAVCRTKVEALSELTAFRTAGALSDGSRAERFAQWSRLYSPGTDATSPASRLNDAIRNTVNAEADKYGAAGSGVLSAQERAIAVRTMQGEYVPAITKPLSGADELALLNAALDEDTLR